MFLPFIIEFAQVFAYSRWASMTHALAGLSGMVLGRVGSVALTRIAGRASPMRRR
jgi:hypothetical protein